jgi:anti-sigma factor RsiW
LLEPFIDGELAAAQRQAVERHLAGCAGCAASLAEARELAGALRALPELACPPAVTAAVLAHARADVASAGGAGAGNRRMAGAATLPFPGPRRTAPRAEQSARTLPPPSATFRGWRAAAAAALLVAAGASALLLVEGNGLRNSPASSTAASAGQPAPPLTPEELARAEIEVKLALAYLTEVGRDAGTTVRDEMVDNVFAPTHRALR